MTARDAHGRFTRSPLTFAQRVEAEVWADLEAQVGQLNKLCNYQTRGRLLTVAFDTAAERLEWLGVA